MALTLALAAAATVVAIAFAGCTFERWLASRARYELAWGVALGLFAAASAALWAGAALGWSPGRFRTFYALGAVANVPVLALGTIYLLAGRRAGDRAAIVVATATAFGVGVVAAAPFTGTIDPDVLPQGSDVFAALPRVVAVVASAGGALVVFGGAALSAIRAGRGRGDGRRALGNALIAAGTGVLSASGLLNSVVGAMDAFSLTLTVGITVVFAGFLVASSTSRPR